ncbi:STM4015 family protein (plasmid) [Embleya sp. NBC_00888]|uniref:STM4015 family protein n=1 Tax=Embleya sp. NBC_00888 TaxID=2975960 RepID=UPI002F908BFA|nr:STM4015 family protein [Embleya sp. NBC_00888]
MAAARPRRLGLRLPTDAWVELVERFLDAVDSARITALVVGDWGAADPPDTVKGPVALLGRSAGRLPDLRALFIGDIVREEQDIAYIEQTDLAPLLGAYPRLEILGARGGSGLRLPTRTYPHLRELRLESGGMPREVVQAVAGSVFPELRRLDIWLGIGSYGGNATVEDLAGILDGAGLPALSHLGLMDSEISDEIATALASAPIVARLKELDLSMGTLSNAGAEVLLAGQPLTHLARLDARHHFLDEATQLCLRNALAGVDVDLSDTRNDWGGNRYVEVSE